MAAAKRRVEQVSTALTGSDSKVSIALINPSVYPMANRTLETLVVQKTFVDAFPTDPMDSDNMSRISRSVPNAMLSFVKPVPLRDLKVVCTSTSALHLIELDEAETKRQEFAELMNGQFFFSGIRSWSNNYAGHQFGVFAGQLGDGRAISLGEILNSREERWELQLKGAGRTPYSRHSDGRAVVRSSIREFLCSEAMAHLGIPTTRVIALAVSPEIVLREQEEHAAVVARLAPSWLRFGNFELAFYRNQPDMIKLLADYLIKYHFTVTVPDGDYEAMFSEITNRTADLIAYWQAYGFCHGVLNTDNMSCLGLTLDYGPFAFMNAFDPTYICNESDEDGRYSFENQPAIGQWNLGRLATALLPLFDNQTDKLITILQNYNQRFSNKYLDLMKKRLGLATVQNGDVDLIKQLCLFLQHAKFDYNYFFRTLSEHFDLKESQEALLGTITIPSNELIEWQQWLRKYRDRVELEAITQETARQRMQQVNPKYILRNYLAQQAIELAESHNDFDMVRDLLFVLSSPFDEHKQHEAWALPPPSTNASNLRCSCSS